jgi:hypothetical protein
MERLLQRFIPGIADHLTDDRIVGLFSRELPFLQRLIARRHLAQCRQCRVRQVDLEGSRVDQVMRDFHDAIETRQLVLPAEPEAEFAQWLKVHMRQPVPSRRWPFHFLNISFPELPPMNPVLVTCVAFCIASIVSFSVFLWQQRVPDITSNALLVRAERWDNANLSSSASVVYQVVRITASGRTMDRSIYRDTRGKRQPKRVKLAEKDERLKVALSEAGVDWDEPISASSYQEWHDRQHMREDRITRAGSHLLKLTTEVPEGSVSEQSLTVRDSDFHPVSRTIAFRDSGTVEIAELDFKMLPWSSVDTSVFEPIGGMETAMTTTSSRVLSFPLPPERLSEDQLDEIELGARLMLNRLNADTGEQIEIARTEQGVEVRGLVETNARKRALQTQLAAVPHLTVDLQSVADLKNSPGINDGVKSIKEAPMLDVQSPLETYLLAHGRGVRAINVLEQRLFDNALTISQESKAIEDLQARFVPDDRKTVIATATLSELIYSHHERLEAALKQERELLGEIQAASAVGDRASTRKASPLLDAAVRNLVLCKELTLADSPNTRSAEKLLAEMSVLLNDLTADAREAYGKPHGDSTMSKTK